MLAQIPRPLRRAALIGLLLAFVFLIAKCALGSQQPSGQQSAAQEEGAQVSVFELVASGADSGRARAEVRPTDSGLAVALKVEELPKAPAGSYYEVWFVGEDDTPGSPQRVSAGTFREGTSSGQALNMTSGADLERYPRMEVTLEPDDGNPAREGVKRLASSR